MPNPADDECEFRDGIACYGNPPAELVAYVRQVTGDRVRTIRRCWKRWILWVRGWRETVYVNDAGHICRRNNAWPQRLDVTMLFPAWDVETIPAAEVEDE